jgi:GDPmannose 4,6-dehydratase
LNAIIFGSNGQDGHFLIKLLRYNNIDVIDSSRKNSNYNGYIEDLNFVENLIKQFVPDYIFHFAANSSTSHTALFENHNAISTGTINILESSRKYSPNSKIFLSGSAMQFKNDGFPIDENSDFEAKSPYAFSRIHSVYVGRYYREVFGMKIYVGYFFNHDSILRSENHINMKIAQFVKKVALGFEGKLIIGNLDVMKEFNYAEDVVEAVWCLVNQEIHFELVIGSGKAYSILDWTKSCFTMIGKKWDDYVVVDNNYKPEYKILVSNPRLLISIGWKPKTNFKQLVNIIINLK